MRNKEIKVVYFINKTKKPIIDRQTKENIYPLYFRFFYNGNTFTRQSSFMDHIQGLSDSEFDKYEKQRFFEKPISLIQRIVAKYIDDSASKHIFDMSHCPWYGRSEKKEMNDINAYIDFYGSSVYSIEKQAIEIEFAEKLKEYIDKNIPAELKDYKFPLTDITGFVHANCGNMFKLSDSDFLIDLFEDKKKNAKFRLIERVISDPDKLKMLQMRQFSLIP